MLVLRSYLIPPAFNLMTRSCHLTDNKSTYSADHKKTNELHVHVSKNEAVGTTAAHSKYKTLSCLNIGLNP